MQAHDEVPPDEKNQKYLPKARPGIDPKIRDFIRVVDIDAGKNARAPCIDDVHEQ